MRIRRAGESDKQEILKLLNTGFSDIQRTSNIRGDNFWNWKFVNNPFGMAKLTVAEADNRIVAVNNLWPWEFYARGTILKALQPCDSIVDPAFRGKGLFRKMRLHGVEMAKKEGVNFLFNFPNENSLAVYMSLGWHYIGRINWRVKVLKPAAVLKELFSNGISEPVIPREEYLIDYEIINRIAQNNYYYDGFLKISRAKGFHEWRYGEHPNRRYGMIVYDQGYKSTVLIFTLNDKDGEREMVIVDIIGSDKGILPAIRMAVNAGRKMNVGFIAIMDNPRFQTGVLWKAGFIRKKMKNMVVLPLDLGIDDILKNRNNWSLMACMHDSI